ncbi:hypothetical protein ACTHQW_05550 [Dietzia maris]
MNDAVWMAVDGLALGCAALAAVLWIVRCVEMSRADRVGEPSVSFQRRSPVTLALIVVAVVAVALGILRMFAAVM